MTEESFFQPFRKAVENFGKLPEADWQLAVPHLQIKAVKKGGLFAKEGRTANEIGVVIKGSFRQYYTKEGSERTTYFFFQNDLVCSYVSCLTNKPSLITIEALTDAEYIVCPYKVLTVMYEKSNAWNRFGRLVAEYVAVGLEERMAGLLMQRPEERYRDLLESNKHKIIEQIPQQYIASYLGISAVSMSRIRNRLAKR
ncbi:MAG TPA: Crp/Fnr family transcriptional regulator [Flavisolibacter sp.]|nr:Crp/Fnr family transcriptional regulator [Flavisolibacter sp.]